MIMAVIRETSRVAVFCAQETGCLPCYLSLFVLFYTCVGSRRIVSLVCQWSVCFEIEDKK